MKIQKFESFISEGESRQADEYRRFKEQESKHMRDKHILDLEIKKAQKTHNLSSIATIRHKYLQWKLKFNKFMYNYYRLSKMETKKNKWKTYTELAQKELITFRRQKGINTKNLDND